MSAVAAESVWAIATKGSQRWDEDHDDRADCWVGLDDAKRKLAVRRAAFAAEHDRVVDQGVAIKGAERLLRRGR